MAEEDHCRMDDDPPTDGMYHMRLYGPQTDVDNGAFMEVVKRLAGVSDGRTMLCVAGDFNSHIGVFEPGDEKSIGIFGRGTWNMKWRELVEMLRRNGLAVAACHFLPEEGEPHNNLQERTAQDRARSCCANSSSGG